MRHRHPALAVVTAAMLVACTHDRREILFVPSDSDVPATAGGWQESHSVTTVAVSQVRVCVAQVRNAVTSWAADQALTVVVDDVTPKSITMHVDIAGSKDFFEVVYVVDTDARRAKISFWLIDDGTERQPTSAPRFKPDELIDNLSRAGKC